MYNKEEPSYDKYSAEEPFRLHHTPAKRILGKTRFLLLHTQHIMGLRGRSMFLPDAFTRAATFETTQTDGLC